MTLMQLAAWALDPEDKLAFSVELTIFIGALIIATILLLIRMKYTQLTLNGWIELFIGALFISLKGLFDGLDTIAPDGLAKDIFDYSEAILMFLGLALLGIGLLRIAMYSAKVWEVR